MRCSHFRLSGWRPCRLIALWIAAAVSAAQVTMPSEGLQLPEGFCNDAMVWPREGGAGALPALVRWARANGAALHPALHVNPSGRLMVDARHPLRKEDKLISMPHKCLLTGRTARDTIMTLFGRAPPPPALGTWRAGEETPPWARASYTRRSAPRAPFVKQWLAQVSDGGAQRQPWIALLLLLQLGDVPEQIRERFNASAARKVGMTTTTSATAASRRAPLPALGFYAPYAGVLPARGVRFLPHLFNDTEINWLRGSQAVFEHAKERKGVLRSAYAAFCAALRQEGIDAGDPERHAWFCARFPLRDFLWAYAAVQSRAWSTRVKDAADESGADASGGRGHDGRCGAGRARGTEGSRVVTDLVEQAFKDYTDLTLVPLVDLANHVSTAPFHAVSESGSTGYDGFSLRASTDSTSMGKMPLYQAAKPETKKTFETTEPADTPVDIKGEDDSVLRTEGDADLHSASDDTNLARSRWLEVDCTVEGQKKRRQARRQLEVDVSDAETEQKQFNSGAGLTPEDRNAALRGEALAARLHEARSALRASEAVDHYAAFGCRVASPMLPGSSSNAEHNHHGSMFSSCGAGAGASCRNSGNATHSARCWQLSLLSALRLCAAGTTLNHCSAVVKSEYCGYEPRHGVTGRYGAVDFEQFDLREGKAHGVCTSMARFPLTSAGRDKCLSTFPGHRSWIGISPDVPSGCSIRANKTDGAESDRMVHWNWRAHGAGRADLSPVCMCEDSDNDVATKCFATSEGVASDATRAWLRLMPNGVTAKGNDVSTDETEAEAQALTEAEATTTASDTQQAFSERLRLLARNASDTIDAYITAAGIYANRSAAADNVTVQIMREEITDARADAAASLNVISGDDEFTRSSKESLRLREVFINYGHNENDTDNSKLMTTYGFAFNESGRSFVDYTLTTRISLADLGVESLFAGIGNGALKQVHAMQQFRLSITENGANMLVQLLRSVRAAVLKENAAKKSATMHTTPDLAPPPWGSSANPNDALMLLDSAGNLRSLTPAQRGSAPQFTRESIQIVAKSFKRRLAQSYERERVGKELKLNWPHECQALSNFYGIVPNDPFAECVPQSAIDFWVVRNCTSIPTVRVHPGCPGVNATKYSILDGKESSEEAQDAENDEAAQSAESPCNDKGTCPDEMSLEWAQNVSNLLAQAERGELGNPTPRPVDVRRALRDNSGVVADAAMHLRDTAGQRKSVHAALSHGNSDSNFAASTQTPSSNTPNADPNFLDNQWLALRKRLNSEMAEASAAVLNTSAATLSASEPATSVSLDSIGWWAMRNAIVLRYWERDTMRKLHSLLEGAQLLTHRMELQQARRWRHLRQLKAQNVLQQDLQHNESNRTSTVRCSFENLPRTWIEFVPGLDLSELVVSSVKRCEQACCEYGQPTQVGRSSPKHQCYSFTYNANDGRCFLRARGSLPLPAAHVPLADWHSGVQKVPADIQRGLDGDRKVESLSQAQQRTQTVDDNLSAAEGAKSVLEEQAFAQLEKVHRAADLKAIEEHNLTMHTSTWGQVRHLNMPNALICLNIC
eukprot:g1321.t1